MKYELKASNQRNERGDHFSLFALYEFFQTNAFASVTAQSSSAYSTAILHMQTSPVEPNPSMDLMFYCCRESFPAGIVGSSRDLDGVSGSTVNSFQWQVLMISKQRPHIKRTIRRTNVERLRVSVRKARLRRSNVGKRSKLMSTQRFFHSS